tara:strand:+ start:1708 stop:1905 length:198 start_codon:yes stop_codon:yes gene_type:complete
MKTQMGRFSNRLELVPESKIDVLLMKLMKRHLFKDESKWFISWGDIDIDGDDTCYEGYRVMRVSD